VNIDFTQMHCARYEVREQMEKYIDVAAERAIF